MMAKRVRQVLLLLTLCLRSVTSSNLAEETRFTTTAVSVNPKSGVKFPRAQEVREKCPALTLREPEENAGQGRLQPRRRPLMDRLSFAYGDWEQAERRAVPVIPFLQLEPASALPAKIQLGSLWITDVGQSPGQQVRQLSGILELMIFDGQSDHGPVFFSEAQFSMVRGFSVLTIEVEGIYQQAQNEDVVCMLGCTVLPSPDGAVNFSNIQNPGGTKTLHKECNIMVQLNYPLTYNLTSRVISGTIHSLASPLDRYNFSPISLSSQISATDAYEATAGALVSLACTGGGGSESQVPGPVNAYTPGDMEFCMLTQRSLMSGSMLDIEPGWKCNGTAQYCQKIGPFSSYGEHTAFSVDYNTSRAQIMVQIVQSPCDFDEEENSGVPISLVLRLVPADEGAHLARDRSALDGQTLVAEGFWAKGSDTLCMVGCKFDYTSGQADNCNARISLHIPLSLSITRRNLFKGSISSLLPQDHPDSFFPVGFHVKLDYSRSLTSEFSSALRYNYSRLDEAGAVLTQHEPESSRLKTALLKYPSLIGKREGHYQSLAADLSFHKNLKSRRGEMFSFLDFYVVSIDDYLPFIWSGFVTVSDDVSVVSINDTIVTETDPKWTHRRQEVRKYLNCSGTLVFSDRIVRANSSFLSPLSIFTEGYYSPTDGKMYMVGCRSIKGSWQQIEEDSYDLIDGMDCEIEVVLEYPTTLAAWLLSPGVKVNVHSKRPVDDTFHFDDIDTQTFPVLYKKQRENVVSQRNVEGALSVITLSLIVACIISQLFYCGNHLESTPYISLFMLSAQAMRYTIPLITGAQSLLTRKFDNRKYFIESGSTQIIIYLDKILTLVALLLLVRLFEKVWRERSLLSDMEESATVPREHFVVVICFFIHAIGFVSVMAIGPRNSVSNADTVLGDTGPLWQVSKEYAGLIEDLFLLPQAIGFGLWDVAGKPLRLSFLAGLTLLQIVPHVYDYLRDPGFAFSYRNPMYANPSFDFYTHVGNILIPALALLLTLLVYCQQRWKGFLRFPTRFLYKPVGAKISETELIITNGRNHLPPIPEDDDE